MNHELVIDNDHDVEIFDAESSQNIRSLQELYSTWDVDSVVRKGYRRICDLKWLALAWHECMCSNHHTQMDTQFGEVTMQNLGWGSKLLERWRHEPIPILRMSLQQVVDSLLGVEWYVFCELYDLDISRGNSEWIANVRRTVELLRFRAYFLATHALSTSVLDVEDYVLTEVEMDSLPKGNDDDSGQQQQQEHSGILRPDDFTYLEANPDDQKKQQEMAAERKERLLLQHELDSLMRMYMQEGVDSRTTRVNLNMAFDVNTILHSLDTGLDRYTSNYSSLPVEPLDKTVEHILVDVRKTLMERFQTMSTLVRLRRGWHCDLVCLPSFRLIHGRRKGLLAANAATDEDVVLGKLGNAISSRIPNVHAEFILQPIGLNRTKWLQVNTDALVYIFSLQVEGGGYQNMWNYLVCSQEQYEARPNVLLSTNNPDRQKPRIFRIRVSGLYVLHDINGQVTVHPSVCHALIRLRRNMIQRNDSPLIYEFFSESGSLHRGGPLSTRAFQRYNLAQCDELFKLQADEAYINLH